MKNTKIVLLIFASISLLITLFSGLELLKPLRNDTHSVVQTIVLKPNTTISFETHYDYGYRIELKLDSNETICDSLGYELTIKQLFNNQTTTNKQLITLGNAYTFIGDFSADEGDECSLTFTSVGSNLRGKKVNLFIDVIGGGPSVGNAFARELRPIYQKTF